VRLGEGDEKKRCWSVMVGLELEVREVSRTHVDVSTENCNEYNQKE